MQMKSTHLIKLKYWTTSFAAFRGGSRVAKHLVSLRISRQTSTQRYYCCFHFLVFVKHGEDKRGCWLSVKTFLQMLVWFYCFVMLCVLLFHYIRAIHKTSIFIVQFSFCLYFIFIMFWSSGRKTFGESNLLKSIKIFDLIRFWCRRIPVTYANTWFWFVEVSDIAKA